MAHSVIALEVSIGDLLTRLNGLTDPMSDNYVLFRKAMERTVDAVCRTIMPDVYVNSSAMLSGIKGSNLRVASSSR